MGPLIQRTISRLETTKLDQNVKKQGCCRCEGKRVFSAGRKKKQTMEVQMAGGSLEGKLQAG